MCSAIASTLVLYLCVYSACVLNLRGRLQLGPSHSMSRPHRPIAWHSVVSHPAGSAFERWFHTQLMSHGTSGAASGAVAAASGLFEPMLKLLHNSTFADVTACGQVISTLGHAYACWWMWLMVRLLWFELTFDLLFYCSHRAVHAVPYLYRVHKLHHAHTYDVRLLSTLQMGPADVIITHTLPVLGALWLVPVAPGAELACIKAYLLFQELYGHAGVEHRGRCFGPAPFLVRALGIELSARDHRTHHIRGGVNFSKRFSLWDKAFGTWDGTERPA